jgi:hypothetical protein
MGYLGTERLCCYTEMVLEPIYVAVRLNIQRMGTS